MSSRYGRTRVLPHVEGHHQRSESGTAMDRAVRPPQPRNRGGETGNVGQRFDAHLELLKDVAGTLEACVDATLTEGWITDNALRDELAIKAIGYDSRWPASKCSAPRLSPT
jgi:hypothetical protein